MIVSRSFLATACIVAVVLIGTSTSMASVIVDFKNARPARDLSVSGDTITLDFTIDGTGDVTLDATPVGASTNAAYLAAVESLDSPPSVGTVADAALYGESFQITIFSTRLDRTTLDPLPAERLSLDGGYSNGILGMGGGNGSRVDWTSGAQEIMHFEQTGGTVQINLLDFAWHAASTVDDLWDTRLVAGTVDTTYTDLPGSSGVVDVGAGIRHRQRCERPDLPSAPRWLARARNRLSDA